MKRHPHLHQLQTKGTPRIVSVVVVMVITFSLVMCSVLFDMGYKIFLNKLTQLETTLESKVTWSNVYLNFSGSINIRDVEIYKDKSLVKGVAQADREFQLDFASEEENNLTAEREYMQRLVLFSPLVELNISGRKFLKVMFTPFEEIPLHDQARLKILNGKPVKKMDYFIIKSLHSVTISDISGNVLFPVDDSFFTLLEDEVFSKKILPQDCSVQLGSIDMRIDVLAATLYTKDFDLDFSISDTKGISSKYAGSLEVQKISQFVKTNIEGSFSSNDFFENMTMYTELENTELGDTFRIAPAKIQVNKYGNDILFHVSLVDEDIDFIGSMIDDILEVDVKITDAKVNQFLSLIGEYEISDYIDDSINGGGKIKSNLKDSSLEYFLNIKNVSRKKNKIDIDIKGNQNHITFEKLIIAIDGQYLDVQGDVSFLTFGANGSLAFKLDKPLLDVPLQADILFTNYPHITRGVSRKFLINNQYQSPFEIAYSAAEKFFDVKFKSNDLQSIQVRGNENNYYRVRAKRFPGTYIAPYLSLENFGVIKDVLFDIDLAYKYENNRIENVFYYLRSSYDNGKGYLLIDGTYDNNKIEILNSQFTTESINMSGSIDGYIYTKDLRNKKDPVSLALKLKNNLSNEEYTYKVRLNTDKTNKYSILLNDNLSLGFLYDAAEKVASSSPIDIDSIHQITLVSNNFSLPYQGNSFYLSSNSKFLIDKGKLNGGNIDITVSDGKNDFFVLQGDYDNNNGEISDIRYATNAHEVNAEGHIEYEPENKTFRMNINEKVGPGTNPLSLQTNISSPQSLSLEYNVGAKQMSVVLDSLRLNVFSEKLGGLVSGNMSVDLAESTAYLNIRPSTLIYDSGVYAISGDFFLSGLSTVSAFEINNLQVKNGSKVLNVAKLTADRQKNIRADFMLGEEKNNLVKTLYDGELLLKVDDGELDIAKFFDVATDENSSVVRSGKEVNSASDDKSKNSSSIADVSANSEIPPSKNSQVLSFLQNINDFSASVVLRAQFEQDADIRNRYSYEFLIDNKDSVFFLKEMDKGVYLEYNADDYYLTGKMGTQGGVLMADVSGNLFSDALNLDWNIIKFDMGKYNKEYVHDTSILELEDLLLNGKLSFRGSLIEPALYGYINIETLYAYVPFFDKDISMKESNVLISNNEISLANSYIEIDKNKLRVNAQGVLNALSLDSVSIDFFTRNNDFLNVKQLRLANMQLDGEIAGKVSVLLEDNIMDVSGDVDIDNALISNEKLSPRQRVVVDRNREEKIENELTIYVNINLIMKSRVSYVWPTSLFPILKAGFANEQKVEVQYNGELNEFATNADIFFNSGTIYYLNKSFDIKKLNVSFDSFSGANNPFIVYLDATSRERYNSQSYTLQLNAQSTLLSDMKVDISATPYLSNEDLASIFGQDIVPSTQDNQDSSTVGIVSTLVKLSDPVSNIGVFSRFESLLQRSLKVDYLTFRTKFVQNILEYSLSSLNDNNANSLADSSVNATFSASGTTSDSLLPYLLNESTFEIGKYIDIVYLNFAIELDTAGYLGVDASGEYPNQKAYLPVNTSFNVELPTPFFDLRWSMSPYTYNAATLVPINSLTLSWQRRF